MAQALSRIRPPAALAGRAPGHGHCGCMKCRRKRRFALEALIESGTAESEFATSGPTLDTPSPGYSYNVKRGDTLLGVAGRAYGAPVGSAQRLRDAQTINAHPANKKFWISPATPFNKRHYAEGIISFSNRFTCTSPQKFARSDERKCYAKILIPNSTNDQISSPIMHGSDLLRQVLHGGRTLLPAVGAREPNAIARIQLALAFLNARENRPREIRLTINGSFDKNTRAAIVNFQQQSGVAVSGHIDSPTVKALDDALSRYLVVEKMKVGNVQATTRTDSRADRTVRKDLCIITKKLCEDLRPQKSGTITYRKLTGPTNTSFAIENKEATILNRPMLANSPFGATSSNMLISYNLKLNGQVVLSFITLSHTVIIYVDHKTIYSDRFVELFRSRMDELRTRYNGDIQKFMDESDVRCFPFYDKAVIHELFHVITAEHAAGALIHEYRRFISSNSALKNERLFKDLSNRFWKTAWGQKREEIMSHCKITKKSLSMMIDEFKKREKNG